MESMIALSTFAKPIQTPVPYTPITSHMLQRDRQDLSCQAGLARGWLHAAGEHIHLTNGPTQSSVVRHASCRRRQRQSRALGQQSVVAWDAAKQEASKFEAGSFVSGPRNLPNSTIRPWHFQLP